MLIRNPDERLANMKQYVIDELRIGDHEKIKSYLDENFRSSEVEGIYWIPIENGILNEIQAAHKDCSPFFFAVSLEPNLLGCELLVRTRNRMRCDCMSYATEEQRNWIIRSLDDIFEKLEIKI